MITVKLDTGFNIEVDFPISPFHRRMFAWIIDTFFLWFFYKMGNKIIGGFIGNKSDTWNWVYILLIYLPILIYYPLMEWLTSGQTIGKRIMNIRVITMEGGQASVSQYLLRWAFRSADFPTWLLPAIYMNVLPWYWSVLLFSGIVCFFVSAKSQRIGDLVAGTIVIFTKNKTSWQDTVFIELESDYKPRYPQVMQMSDKDVNSLKMIIGAVRKGNNHELAFRIAERIKWKLNMQSDQSNAEFLETLLKDYNYYSTH
jgi:uncharacterized RDD family membrane protein YckC